MARPHCSIAVGLLARVSRCGPSPRRNARLGRGEGQARDCPKSVPEPRKAPPAARRGDREGDGGRQVVYERGRHRRRRVRGEGRRRRQRLGIEAQTTTAMRAEDGATGLTGRAGGGESVRTSVLLEGNCAAGRGHGHGRRHAETACPSRNPQRNAVPSDPITNCPPPLRQRPRSQRAASEGQRRDAAGRGGRLGHPFTSSTASGPRRPLRTGGKVTSPAHQG